MDTHFLTVRVSSLMSYSPEDAVFPALARGLRVRPWLQGDLRAYAAAREHANRTELHDEAAVHRACAERRRL